MVREGVVLGHVVLGKGLEVDKTRIEVIQNLPLPSTVKDLRSFLEYVGFYRRFTQDFAKVSKPLTTLLCKDIGDTFSDENLLAISSHAPWYAHIVNFIVTGSIPEHWNWHQKDKFFHELKYYFWEELLLFHLGYE